MNPFLTQRRDLQYQKGLKKQGILCNQTYEIIAFCCHYCRVIREKKPTVLEADMLNKHLPAVHKALHNVALAVVLFMVCASPLLGVLSWAEIVPWPVLNVTLSDGSVHNAVPYLGAAISFIGIVMLALVPGSKRVLTLEQTHREFKMTMDDVAGAFYAAFTADRDGIFKIKGEFDAIRARHEYLKSLPNLPSLEPDILLQAAQMSYVSEELARAYGTDAVERARDFLKSRQDEINRFSALLKSEEAELPVIRDLALTLRDQDRMNHETRNRLDEQLRELVAPLGYVKETARTTVLEFPSQTPISNTGE